MTQKLELDYLLKMKKKLFLNEEVLKEHYGICKKIS